MRTKRKKRVKLENKAKIRRRLLRLWKELVRLNWHNQCAVCGRKDKEPLENGKLAILNCHHIESERNRTTRYDPANGILLCPSHHKFGKESFHRSAVWSMAWMKKNHPWLLSLVERHREEEAWDFNDREVLGRIENFLKRRIRGRKLSPRESPKGQGKTPPGPDKEA